MTEITLKIRIFSFFFITVIMIPICVLLLYFSLNEIRILFNYPDVIVFTSHSLASIIITPFVLFYLIIISCKPIFLGKRISNHIQVTTARFLIVAIVSGLISQIGFKVYYKETLNNKNYVVCSGIPSGFLPGMATKYATSETLCLKQSE